MRRYARGMPRSPFRRLLRCRALFALAICAWLGLAGSVFARADCCAGMGGMGNATTMTHHDGVPAPLHADGVHADCACAHATASLPLPNLPLAHAPFVAAVFPVWIGAAWEHTNAPPLRPPLA